MTPSNDWHARDIAHLWHPYTEITEFEQNGGPLFDHAEGVYLYERGGRKLIDGIASWWCVNLGHSHPRLVDAIQNQAATLQHCILGGVSHPNAIRLAERLAAMTPKGLNHAYFCGDGASAVEAALRMALQYWVNIGQRQRTEFICLADGYHGDTFGAVGVGYVETFHKDFEHVIKKAHRACSPHCAQCPYDTTPETCAVDCFESMAQMVRHHADTAAAVILEPLCQGAGGIRIYPEDYLRRLRALCDEHDLLLITDEIATGFGRTGSMFACDRAGISPDLMTLGKGMTGGYLPMSAVMVTDRVYDSFRRDGQRVRTFYHGHTYCGNPITSAVALAALDVYKELNILEHIQPRIKQIEQGVRKIASQLPHSHCRTLGLIASIEIAEQDGGAARATQTAKHAYERGLYIRPLGAVVYLWPPLTITHTELNCALNILAESMQEAGKA